MECLSIAVVLKSLLNWQPLEQNPIVRMTLNGLDDLKQQETAYRDKVHKSSFDKSDKLAAT